MNRLDLLRWKVEQWVPCERDHTLEHDGDDNTLRVLCGDDVLDTCSTRDSGGLDLGFGRAAVLTHGVETLLADLRDLLAVAEQARGVIEAYDQAGTVDWTGELVDTRLRAALARLDAVTGGETPASQCCRDNVPHAGGVFQEGQGWCCPECGTEWVHVIEESEGAWWQPAVTGGETS